MALLLLIYNISANRLKDNAKDAPKSLAAAMASGP